MTLMDFRPRRLPWEAPVQNTTRKRRPWLRLAILCLAGAGAAVAVAGLVECNTSILRNDGPRAKDAKACNCEPRVDLPGTIPPDFVVDPAMQAFATALLTRHPAVLTMAFGMDLRTARPLFLVTRAGSQPVGHDLSLITAPRYPFASLAKILTSAAAMNEAGYSPSSPVYLRGQSHTLYKFQLNPDNTGISMPLAKAFAYSVNPVFGKLGMNNLGSRAIMGWADSLGFNRPRGLGNGVPSGRMASPVDSYNLAEISSGFVRTTLGSPVQAAMIVRKFAGDGKFRPPSWNGFELDSLCPPDTAEPNLLSKRMLELFRATVDSGTAHGGFQAAWPMPERGGFDLGGKTGSLDGTDPPGRYEWFAGYARLAGDRDSGIAVGVLTVNDFRGALSASWTAATLLAAWSRRFDILSDPVPVSRALATGTPFLTSDDQDALSEHAWHRPWNPRKKVHIRRKHR